MKLDVLAINVNPDDAELSCSGTLIVEKLAGKKTGMVDLTRGELGTRGTPELRIEEANRAAAFLKLDYRSNLGLRDGFFEINEASLIAIIRELRKLQPTIVLTNAPEDRHPDHGRAAKLVVEACFLSGLRKIETTDEEGNPQAAWRPKQVYHYIQDRYLTPTFVVDITAVMDQKLEAIKLFDSQFYDPNSKEPATYISTPYFLEGVISRASVLGKLIQVQYGEGFISANPPGVSSLFNMLIS